MKLNNLKIFIITNGLNINYKLEIIKQFLKSIRFKMNMSGSIKMILHHLYQ